MLMRRNLIDLVIIDLVILAALAGTARAGSTTLTFDALAGDVGDIVTTSFVQGGFTVYVNDSLITDDGGTIGVRPESDDPLEITAPTFILATIAGTFGTGTPDWTGETTIGIGGAVWNWPGTGDETGSYTPPGTCETTLTPPQSTATVYLSAAEDNGASITSITLTTQDGPPSVPEPAGAVLLGLGGFITALVGSLRKRKTPADESGGGGRPIDTTGPGGPASLPGIDESIEFAPMKRPSYPPGTPSLRWRRGDR